MTRGRTQSSALALLVALTLPGVACFEDPEANDGGTGDDEVGDTTETSGESGTDTSGSTDTGSSEDTTTSETGGSEDDTGSTDTSGNVDPVCGDGSADPGELCLDEVPVEYAVGQQAVGIAVGELDAGVMGVAVTDPGSTQLAILRGDQNGGLLGADYVGLAGGGDTVDIGDVDVDGDMDLVVDGNPLSLLRNDGGGGWELVEVDPGPLAGSPSRVVLGQLDGTPALDFVFGEGYNTVWVLGSTWGGWSIGSIGGDQYSGGDEYIVLTEFGFDGDGFTDMLVSSRWLGEVYFNRGQGNGTFTEQGVTPVCTPGSCNIVELHAADLDGDENPDIITSLDVGLSVCLGKDDGTFETFELYAAPGAKHVASGDVDNDGDVDLLVSSVEDGHLRLFLGDGAGGLEAPMVFETPADETRSVAIADMNQDGAPELVTAYNYNGGGWVGVFEAQP